MTYHGGETSISYPWGNFAHKKDTLTGDNNAFSTVADLLVDISGKND